MNTEHNFVAERPAAQHCAELLRKGPEPADLIPALGRTGASMARALAPLLAELVGGEEPSVTPLAPSELTEGDLILHIGMLAANSLLATGVPGVTVLASIEGTAVLRLVDRAYGGKGEASGPLPAAFPMSAELLIDRLEKIVARTLGEALGQGELRTIRRDSKLDELTPFPAGARLAMLQFEVMEGVRAPWKITLALPLGALPKLLGSGDAGPAAQNQSGPADPAAAPYADVPLPMVATLVDMKVALATVSQLEPGMVLPVAVARAVPLSIAGAVIARAAIGTQDDCVAIKLSQIAS